MNYENKYRKIGLVFTMTLLILGTLGMANVFTHSSNTLAATENNTVATLNFITTDEYPFEDGSTTKEYLTDKEAIETMSLPLFKNNETYSFVGWRLDSMNYASTTLHPNNLKVGETYSPEALLREGFYSGDEAVFSAVYAQQGATNTTDIYEVGQTMKTHNRVPSISVAAPVAGNLIVYSYDGSNFNKVVSYNLTEGSLEKALYYLYESSDKNLDYIIYVGGTLPGTVTSETVKKTSTATSPSDVSFYALKDKVKSLTITGSSIDDVNDVPTTSAPSSNTVGNLSFSTADVSGIQFGTNVELRNISFSGISNIAANGYKLYLGGGVWGSSAANIYGGSYDGTDVTAQNENPITISSTGYGTWNIYGGNKSGSFTGNTSLTINNTSGPIGNLIGSNQEGTFNGNTNTLINSTSSAINTIIGGNISGTHVGNASLSIMGTGGTVSTLIGGTQSGIVNGNTTLKLYSASAVTSIDGGTTSGTINGNVSNFIRVSDSSTSFSITNRFLGGSYNGTVNGDIYNFIGGYGSYSAPHFGGVGYQSNVGSSENKRKVVTILDTSLYKSGAYYFSGVNRVSGVVYADILNVVRAGRSGRGSIQGFNGTSATESTTLNQTSMGAAGITQNTDLSSTDVDAGSFATTYDGYSLGQRKSIAESGASNRVYGNVTSHALGGCMSNSIDQTGYMRGGGYGGYIEGNTSLTTGIVYGAGKDEKAGGYNFIRNSTVDGYYDGAATNIMKDFAYLVSAQSGSSLRTYMYGAFDIVGGTGEAEGERYGAYLVGDSNLTHNNVLARWTYGSNFGGIHEGNSTITLNGGLVDTLEGSGYRMVRHYGSSQSIMKNGEVNFFYSGGGWGDWAIFGNVTANCSGGVVNCAIGGTYGYQQSSTSHYIFGNVNTVVTGGRFDGYPSHGAPGFSGGATLSGHIYGDVALTLDLRNSTNFSLPSTTNITGGRSFAGQSGGWNNTAINTIGKNENSKITLNVYTAPGTDVLNGTSIYGDGGPANANGSTNSRSGSIIMNIDAPGSKIGNLYATQYQNVVNDSLKKTVNINVLRAGQIGSLSGGNATDSINNTVYSNSIQMNKTVDVKLGTELAENELTGYKVKISDVNAEDENNPDLKSKEITFGTAANNVGLVNFTSLSIENRFIALAGAGSIKNGVNATAANHYNSYDKFGNIRIEDGSGIGVTSPSSYISLGNLTVVGEGNIYSSAGSGKINLSSVTMQNNTDRLTWHMQEGGAAKVASTGTYFGSLNAYQVLTFSSTDTSGQRITNMVKDLTPLNFLGIDDITGKTFVGDTDVKTGGSTTAASHKEYGIMIPGSVIDFKVNGDYDQNDLNKLLSSGTGLISHDVGSAKTSLDNPPLDVYSTVTANKGVVEGRLVIPIKSTAVYPTLSFVPDALSGSWLRNANITSTKVDGSYNETIGEQSNSDTIKWKSGENTGSDANQYSYSINTVFSNQLELSGKSVVVTESDAKKLTTSELVQNIQSVKGRPFLSSSLTEDNLASLASGLETGTYSKVIPVTYTVQDNKTTPVNSHQETWNIVIVPDTSVISESQDFALYANDADFYDYEAKALDNQTTIDTKTHAMAIYADGRANTNASLDTKFIKAINSATAPDVVPITYTASFESQTLSKTININVLQSRSTLTIQFQNEAGTVLSGYTLTAGEADTNNIVTPIHVGDTIDLTSTTYAKVQTQLSTLETAGYELVTRPTNETALPITDVTQTVTYTVKGLLFLQSAPSKVDFGSLTYNAKTQRVDNPTTTGDLVITDTRASTTGGWTLYAAVTTEMKNTSTGSIMSDALRYVTTAGNEVNLSSSNQAVYTNTTGGTTDITSSWGTTSDTAGLKLVADPNKTTVSSVGTYSGVITWTIMAGQP